MKTSDRIAELADQLGAVFDAHPKAGANPDAMAALRGAVTRLGSTDRYTSGCVVELLGKAQVFYSARGFFRMPGQSQRLLGGMRDDLLDRIRMRGRVLASQGD